MISWSYLLHIELADYRTYRFNYSYVLYKWTAWICLVDQTLLTQKPIRTRKINRKEKRSFIMALSVYLMMHKSILKLHIGFKIWKMGKNYSYPIAISPDWTTFTQIHTYILIRIHAHTLTLQSHLMCNVDQLSSW